MKVTVEFLATEVKEICWVTGERKKGPAIRRLVLDALMLKRREEIAGKFISGKWGVGLAGFEEGRIADRKAANRSAVRWRIAESKKMEGTVFAGSGMGRYN